MWSGAFAHFTVDDSIVPSYNSGFMSTIYYTFIGFKLTAEDGQTNTTSQAQALETDSRNTQLFSK